MKRALFAGSFNPITKGHIDVILKGVSAFDEVIVAVANNPKKSYEVPYEQRFEMAKEAIRELRLGGKVKLVEMLDDVLTIEFAKKVGANALLRGLRTTQDFNYEQNMSLVNESLNWTIPTVFVTNKNIEQSSSNVREILRLGIRDETRLNLFLMDSTTEFILANDLYL